jgi:hypothetical protein
MSAPSVVAGVFAPAAPLFDCSWRGEVLSGEEAWRLLVARVAGYRRSHWLRSA